MTDLASAPPGSEEDDPEGTRILTVSDVLGAVLDRFLARYASMNSFTQLALASQTRGTVKTWPPRIGSRSVL